MLSRILQASFVALLAWFSATTVFAQSFHTANTVETALYDQDPGHIANRVYRALYAWKGADESSPIHWPQAKFSLEAAKLRPLLDELQQLDVAREFSDPVKR